MCDLEPFSEIQSHIMLIIILFMLLIVSYYYSIVPIANNTMHKCCNVKLQIVYDNITHVMLYYYKVSMGIVL